MIVCMAIGCLLMVHRKPRAPDNGPDLAISETAWNEISRHAEETFPEECCGVVLSNGITDRAQRLRNIQNELHALDPMIHPRTAAIA